MENSVKTTTHLDNEVDLIEFAQLLWKQKWAVVVITLISLGIATGYILFSTKQYQLALPLKINSNVYPYLEHNIVDGFIYTASLEQNIIDDFIYTVSDHPNFSNFTIVKGSKESPSYIYISNSKNDGGLFKTKHSATKNVLQFYHSKLNERAKNDLTLINSKISSYGSTEFLINKAYKIERYLANANDNKHNIIRAGENKGVELIKPKSTIILTVAILLGLTGGCFFAMVLIAVEKRNLPQTTQC